MKKLLLLFSFALVMQGSSARANVTFGNSIIDVSASGIPVFSGRVGVDDNGNAIAVWNFDGTVQARRLNSSGAINPTINLNNSSNNDIHLLDLSVNDSGNSVAIWSNFATQSVQISNFDLAFSTSTLHTFATINPLNTNVSINNNGIAFALWSDGSSYLSRRQYWSRWNGSSWTAPDTISTFTTPEDNGAIGVDPSNNAIAVYTRKTNLGYQVEASIYTGSWSTPTPLTAVNQNIGNRPIQLAVSKNGTAIAVWQNNNIIEASRYDGVSWSSSTTIQPENISGFVANSIDVLTISIGMDDNGNAVGVWESFPSLGSSIETNYFVQGVGWSTSIPVTISPFNEVCVDPNISVYPNGDAVASWTNEDSGPPIIQSAFFDFSTKTWQNNTPFTLSSSVSRSSRPQVAVSQDRSAYVVWAEYGPVFPVEGSIQTRIGEAPIPPPPPPPPTPPEPPQDLQVKQKLNRFPTQSEIFNVLTWTASTTENVVLYRIFRNGFFVTEILANEPFRYEDHNRLSGRRYTYEIFAIDADGLVSDPATFTIN